MIRTLRLLSAAAVLTALAPCQAQSADHLALGKMWTFENPPLAYLEAEYGFKPDQQWLDSLRLAALRLGERDNPWCSAAFVSPQGLIMTNHHCVRDKVAELGQATGRPDLVDTGYAAKALEDEVQLPGLTVHQLVRQQDITDQVNEGIADDADDQAIAAAREANIEQIQAHAEENAPDLMHQVVALYHGANYQLYSYKVYDDIRLVLAVHLQTAHFGGDPDNFTYPRWSIDFSFVRAYEDGEPADTRAHYFRWRQTGAQQDELVFVPGNPGNTNRLLPVSMLEYQRDVEYPLILQQLENGMAILRPWAERAPGLMTTLLSWENSFKAISGMLGGLHDDELMTKKREHEAAFRAAVTADAEAKVAYGTAWDRFAELSQVKRDNQPQVNFYNASYLPVLDRALAVVRAADEDLDDDERQAAREEAINTQLRENPITQALLVDHFQRAVSWLGDDDAYLRAVAGEHWAGEQTNWPQALDELRQSALRDPAAVQALLEGGGEAIAASEDRAVQVARVLYPLMTSARDTVEQADQAIEVQGARLGRAQFAVFGNKVSPDATMTLRFSDGLVQGYPYNGTVAPWATSFYGLYGRNVTFGDEFPWSMPDVWHAAEDRIDMTKKVCFVSTNDIVGGNSGSSVVDKDLQVVGLIFDGNIESLPNDFYYTQQVARAVSVHTDAIVEAMTKVYGMDRVVEELRAGAAAAEPAGASADKDGE